MFYELIATFAAAFCAAGIVLLLNRLAGGRLPRWLMPAAAGAAMIGYAIWSEYTWAERTRAALPEGLALISQVETARWWKPWTYAAPQVTRFVVGDTASVRRHPERPDRVLVDFYLFERWQPPAKVPQMIDCATGRRALVSDALLRGADGAAGDWIAMEGEDPFLGMICKT